MTRKRWSSRISSFFDEKNRPKLGSLKQPYLQLETSELKLVKIFENFTIQRKFENLFGTVAYMEPTFLLFTFLAKRDFWMVVYLMEK